MAARGGLNGVLGVVRALQFAGRVRSSATNRTLCHARVQGQPRANSKRSSSGVPETDGSTFLFCKACEGSRVCQSILRSRVSRLPTSTRNWHAVTVAQDSPGAVCEVQGYRREESWPVSTSDSASMTNVILLEDELAPATSRCSTRTNTTEMLSSPPASLAT